MDNKITIFGTSLPPGELAVTFTMISTFPVLSLSLSLCEFRVLVLLFEYVSLFVSDEEEVVCSLCRLCFDTGVPQLSSTPHHFLKR